METKELELGTRTFKFTAPSGNYYVIREQNGEDDDILSNPVTSRDLSNLSEFISAIVTETSITSNHKLTREQASELPSNDRYCILIQSRIFSLGDTIEVEYDWGKENGGVQIYEQDLKEFLFDYSIQPTEKDLNEKPDAIPFYHSLVVTDITEVLSSGKEIKFDVLNGKNEARFITLPLEKRTKNQELICRNLHLKVEGKYEKVESFKIFSPKDMGEIRKSVAIYDPQFTGNITLLNPNDTKQSVNINLFSIPGFFFPGE